MANNWRLQKVKSKNGGMGKVKGQELEVSKNQLKEREDDISLIAKTGDCEKSNARMGGMERLNAKNYIEVAIIQMQGWNNGRIRRIGGFEK
jgi:hypothetical protein